jgi:WD40-like Beta Propeller Repeat
VTPASSTIAAASNIIAFATQDADLAVLSMSDLTQRVLVPGPIHTPSLSRDAKRIAYVREGGSSKGDRIEVVNADGSGRVVVLPPQPNPLFQPPDPYVEPFIGIEQVRWSPENSALYFSSNEHNIVGHEICRVDLATGIVSDVMWGLSFDVGPDGSIAFGNFTNAGLFDHPGQWISVVLPSDPYCSGDCSLTNPPRTGYFPAWSPDGGTVGFDDDQQRVWIVGRKSDAGRFVNLGFNVDSLTWSPDGRSLAVAGAGRDLARRCRHRGEAADRRWRVAKLGLSKSSSSSTNMGQWSLVAQQRSSSSASHRVTRPPRTNT